VIAAGCAGKSSRSSAGCARSASRATESRPRPACTAAWLATCSSLAGPRPSPSKRAWSRTATAPSAACLMRSSTASSAKEPLGAGRPSPRSRAAGPAGPPAAPRGRGRSGPRYQPTRRKGRPSGPARRRRSARRTARAASRRRSGPPRCRPRCSRPRGRSRGRARALREDVGEQGESGREDQRGADSHHGAGRDQLAGAVAQAAREARGAEDEQPDEQHALAADPVAEVPRGEHEGREHQVVGVDDPLELHRRGVKLAHQGRQRDVHDRRVEVDRERREEQRDENQRLIALTGHHWLDRRGTPKSSRPQSGR
jgi:hypothetical protein